MKEHEEHIAQLKQLYSYFYTKGDEQRANAIDNIIGWIDDKVSPMQLPVKPACEADKEWGKPHCRYGKPIER